MRILFGVYGGPVKSLILIRHTRPLLAEGICYGRMDLDLAPTWPQEFDRCLAQAPTATRILSSPATRCVRLAQALAQRDGVETQIDARLLELDFGSWEGCAWDDIRREDIDDWVADPVNYAPGGGESLRELWMRVLDLHEALRDRPSGNTLIVSHHGPLRALIAQAARQPMESVLQRQIAWGEVVTLGEPWFASG